MMNERMNKWMDESMNQLMSGKKSGRIPEVSDKYV
jgi:hypothetical protein